jgi:hypothetical protein
MHLRENNNTKEFVKIKPLLNEKTEKKAYAQYKYLVYTRGSVRTKENQAEINEDVYNKAEKNNFSGEGGRFTKRLRFFVDGLVLGSKEVIADWLKKCHETDIYSRRKNPIVLDTGGFCLREQRSHFEKHLV